MAAKSVFQAAMLATESPSPFASNSIPTPMCRSRNSYAYMIRCRVLLRSRPHKPRLEPLDWGRAQPPISAFTSRRMLKFHKSPLDPANTIAASNPIPPNITPIIDDSEPKVKKKLCGLNCSRWFFRFGTKGSKMVVLLSVDGKVLKGRCLIGWTHVNLLMESHRGSRKFLHPEVPFNVTEMNNCFMSH